MNEMRVITDITKIIWIMDIYQSQYVKPGYSMDTWAGGWRELAPPSLMSVRIFFIEAPSDSELWQNLSLHS